MLLVLAIPTLLLRVFYAIWKLSVVRIHASRVIECGFEPFSTSRLSFSLKFFLLILVFLVFDVEVALILPAPVSYANPFWWKCCCGFI